MKFFSCLSLAVISLVSLAAVAGKATKADKPEKEETGCAFNISKLEHGVRIIRTHLETEQKSWGAMKVMLASENELKSPNEAAIDASIKLAGNSLDGNEKISELLGLMDEMVGEARKNCRNK